MTIWEEFDALITAGGLKVCLWFGMPPCPLCNGDHGDPNCSPAKDAAERAAVAAHRVTTGEGR